MYDHPILKLYFFVISLLKPDFLRLGYSGIVEFRSGRQLTSFTTKKTPQLLHQQLKHLSYTLLSWMENGEFGLSDTENGCRQHGNTVKPMTTSAVNSAF